jgi:hypothetical protein
MESSSLNTCVCTHVLLRVMRVHMFNLFAGGEHAIPL